MRLAQPDGEAHWVYLTINTAKDTQGDKVQRVVLTDITEAKFLSRAMLQDDSGLHA